MCRVLGWNRGQGPSETLGQTSMNELSIKEITRLSTAAVDQDNDRETAPNPEDMTKHELGP